MSEFKTTSPFELPDNDPLYGRTVSGAELLRQRQVHLFDEPDTESKYGYFAGRPIIGHDTPINGGVYIGGGQREAIVVDDTSKDVESNALYQKIYDKLLTKAKARQEKEHVHFKNGILDDVYNTVRETILFDDIYVRNISEKYKDRKVNLSYFITEGKGVCRHQALLTAYLLERLKKEGLVSGKVTVERNSIPGVGAHAWARYENSSGAIYVIDPTQEYIGLLSDAPENAWIYKRPEDKVA